MKGQPIVSLLKFVFILLVITSCVSHELLDETNQLTTFDGAAPSSVTEKKATATDLPAGVDAAPARFLFEPQLAADDFSLNHVNTFGVFTLEYEQGVLFLLKGNIWYLPFSETEAIKLFALNTIDGKHSSRASYLSEDEETFFTQSGDGMAIYDDRLYCLAMRNNTRDYMGYSLLSMKLDGSDRRIEYDVSDNIPTRSFVHRGYLFYRTLTANMRMLAGKEYQSTEAYQLHRVDLRTKEEMIFDLPMHPEAILVAGDYLIIPDSFELYKEDAVYQYYAVEIETGECHSIDLQASSRLTYFAGKIIAMQHGSLIAYDPTTGEQVKFAESEASHFFVDDEYLVAETWNMKDPDNERVKYSLYDRQLNLLFETPEIPFTGMAVGFYDGVLYRSMGPWATPIPDGYERLDLKDRATEFQVVMVDESPYQ